MDIHILRPNFEGVSTPAGFYFQLVRLAIYTYGEEYFSKEIDRAKRRRLISEETAEMFYVALYEARVGWAPPYISYIPDGKPHLERPTVLDDRPKAKAVKDFFAKIAEDLNPLSE